MLFDEKKMPYHLMLQKFLLSGGQNAFFDSFYWALSIGYSIPPEDGLDAEDLKVFLTATKPGTAEIEVYARVAHELESDPFIDRHWTRHVS